MTTTKTATVCLLFFLFLGSQSIKYTVFTPLQNMDWFKSYVINISDYKHPQYGQYLERDVIINLITDKSYSISVLNEILVQAPNTHCKNYGYFLKCNGPFVPHLKNYPQVFVETVADHSFLFNKTIREKRTSDIPDSGYVGREVVQRMYNITDDLPSVTLKQSVGVAEYQGSSGYRNLDLFQIEHLNGLQLNPVTYSIGINAFADLETALDLAMGALTMNNLTLWYVSTDGWLATWASEFLILPTVPSIVSHSWGWAIDRQCRVAHCLNESSSQYVEYVNNLYMLIAVRGVTMVVSSGDSGAPGRSDEKCEGINRTVVSDYPGSSPWVLSVGGTYVIADGTSVNTSKTPLCQFYNCTTGTKEATVNFYDVQWTAGGGFAKFFTEERPVWQDIAVRGYLNKKLPMPTFYNPKGRATPDVASLAHNCGVVIDSILTMVDGTSCSSPMFASIVALLNEYQSQRNPPRPNVGLVAPLLYAMYVSDPMVFNDITVGNNWCTETLCCPVRDDGGSDYGYMATDGWDPVAGLGTPNVGRMVQWLNHNT